MAPSVRIARLLDIQPYARSGNIGHRRPRCVFEVQVDGRPMSGRGSLRRALEVARDFDPSVTRSCVYDPVPIPERV